MGWLGPDVEAWEALDMGMGMRFWGVGSLG